MTITVIINEIDQIIRKSTSWDDTLARLMMLKDKIEDDMKEEEEDYLKGENKKNEK